MARTDDLNWPKWYSTLWSIFKLRGVSWELLIAAWWWAGHWSAGGEQFFSSFLFFFLLFLVPVIKLSLPQSMGFAFFQFSSPSHWFLGASEEAAAWYIVASWSITTMAVLKTLQSPSLHDLTLSVLPCVQIHWQIGKYVCTVWKR